MCKATPSTGSACRTSAPARPRSPSALAQLWSLNPKYVDDLAESLPRIPRGTAQEQALAGQVLQQLANGAYLPVCGQVNQNIRETRYDLEIQDTLSLAESVRLVSGMSYRHDQATSETYFDGTVNNDIWRLFGQLEWHLSPHWLLQGGAMAEDDQLSGSSVSPRLALNYLINPRHSLRAVYSEAVRSPDMYENDVNWSYRVRNLSPLAYGQSSAYYFARAHGPGDLDQERMRSREIGYNGQFDELGLAVDIKAYYDEIHGLISDPLQVSDFEPTNDNDIRFSGAETQLDWRLTRQDRIRLTYAYVDYDASSRFDRRLTARNSGSAGWMRDWGRGWSSSVFYYGDDALNEHRFERIDLRVAKRIPLGRAALELAGVLQQRLDDEPLTWPENRYDNRHLLYFSAEVAF